MSGRPPPEKIFIFILWGSTELFEIFSPDWNVVTAILKHTSRLNLPSKQRSFPAVHYQMQPTVNSARRYNRLI